jgi:hypothetical protein
MVTGARSGARLGVGVLLFADADEKAALRGSGNHVPLKHSLSNILTSRSAPFGESRPDDTTANPDPTMRPIAKSALTFLGSEGKVGGLQGMFLYEFGAPRSVRCVGRPAAPSPLGICPTDRRHR